MGILHVHLSKLGYVSGHWAISGDYTYFRAQAWMLDLLIGLVN